jgi:hypothetical protein
MSLGERAGIIACKMNVDVEPSSEKSSVHREFWPGKYMMEFGRLANPALCAAVILVLFGPAHVPSP